MMPTCPLRSVRVLHAMTRLCLSAELPIRLCTCSESAVLRTGRRS